VPRACLARQRLWERLESSADSAVTVVVAPVGAGKTLGVAGWLHETGRAQDTTWIDGTTDVSVSVLREIVEEAVPAADEVLDPGADDEAPALPLPRLLVIDDAQGLPSSAIGYLDHELTEHPDRLRVILLSRWDLPFTRLVPELLGHLSVLRGDVLRLDDTEAAALVAEHARTDSAEVSEAIMARTQGWCAAVVLTAKAVGAAHDPAEAARRYRQGGPGVADRVATEVFAALTTRERHLLLCVAGETSVTGPVAAHLSRDAGAGEVLATLETTGLLVTRQVGPASHGAEVPDPERDAPTADESVAYRLHPLLLEVTRRRLVAGGVDVSLARATVLRAVRLDLARGETSRAFGRLVTVDDRDEAVRVLAAEGPLLAVRGHGSAMGPFARRHPEIVESHPETWLAIALERWVRGDIGVALDELSTPVACLRLMRARLGIEPIAAAARHGERVVASEQDRAQPHPLLMFLMLELGAAQNWLGKLSDAETNLTCVVLLSRAGEVAPLTAAALSHLAVTEYMQGREHACVALAHQSLELAARLTSMASTIARAEVILALATLQDVPWPSAPTTVPAIRSDQVHPADLTSRFWLRMLRSRQMLAGGSVPEAERTLDSPLDAPMLPDHLRVVALVDRAIQATLASDRDTLSRVSRQLAGVGSRGEAAFVGGMRAELLGDERAAEALFATASTSASYLQPATAEMALACRAQLLDSLGRRDEALRVLQLAVTATEVRRNSVPFLGWSRHGTPMRFLLERLVSRTPTAWGLELAEATAEHPGLASFFGPVTATPQEASQVGGSRLRPMLSPREREMLYELARGSTYADIAANLSVSENTVKTHVSNLYGKLAVNRRREALAVARTMRLL
jgi:DNA-binding CsgD family transcriptional regulator